ncbi:MAG: hypothetical protein FWC18_02435, partial [Cystobacterineae bacterium]|nr:hypothetical protein [Cystobacterineae bacterium]
AGGGVAPREGGAEEPPVFPPLTGGVEGVGGLSDQYTPPYEFEGPLSYISNVPSQNADAQQAVVGAGFSSKHGIRFWLRWIFIGWAVAMLLVFLSLMFGWR